MKCPKPLFFLAIDERQIIIPDELCNKAFRVSAVFIVSLQSAAVGGIPLKNQVLQSLETPDGSRCVDLFIRPDGSFGFEIYRRDVETLSGWFAIGNNIDLSFGSQHLARTAAADQAPWLND